MFASIPCDILRLVLEDYLAISVKELSKLDIAFCNHFSRKTVLSTFAQIKVKEKETRLLENYMRWLVSRDIRATVLIMEVHCVRDISGLCLPHIRKIVFRSISRRSIHLTSLGPFLACFPNFNEPCFGMWSDIKDFALQQFCCGQLEVSAGPLSGTATICPLMRYACLWHIMLPACVN